MICLHDEGVIWHNCTIEGCESRFKKGYGVTRHLSRIHDIGVKWCYCPIEGCDVRTKCNSGMKYHLSGVHDVGEFECDFCVKKCSCLSEYDDREGTHRICRSCYNKQVHASSRYEVNMRNYLLREMPQITPYLIAADQTVRGEACGRRYRPDMLYADPNTVIHIECDENQHTFSAGYSCEERRISELYDEFPGKRYFVIRWNPNFWRGGRKSFDTRLKKLRECILEALATGDGPLIRVWYLYYDTDNDSICKHLPIEHKTTY